uniref:Glyoxalase domain-containing protein 5 n=1 Tax=Gasterosteus aculeatus aculeatus TaxID=481459 RepID=A0AAQ4PA07_GASAC
MRQSNRRCSHLYLLTVSIQTLGVRLKQTCPIQVSRLNHLVLTVKSVPDTINFYSSVLGMEVVTFKGTREALAFGQQKFNLHQLGQEFEPKAKHPTPGSAVLCLITSTPLATVAAHLKVVHLSPTEDGLFLSSLLTLIKIISLYIQLCSHIQMHA